MWPDFLSTRMNIWYHRLGPADSKSFVGLIFLRYKWIFELNNLLLHKPNTRNELNIEFISDHIETYIRATQHKMSILPEMPPMQ